MASFGAPSSPRVRMISRRHLQIRPGGAQRLIDHPRLREGEIAPPRPKDDSARSAHSAFRNAQGRFSQLGRIQHPFPRRNEPDAEIIDMARDDLLTGSDLLPSERERLLGNRLERIDVVKKDSFQLVHIGSDVARHGDVDNEKRPVERSRRSGASFAG